MHIAPIPREPVTQYAVYVPVKSIHVNGQGLYQRIGLHWPTLEAAEAFKTEYERANKHYLGKVIIVEVTTTWTVISDYSESDRSGSKDARSAIPLPRRSSEDRVGEGQHRVS